VEWVGPIVEYSSRSTPSGQNEWTAPTHILRCLASGAGPSCAAVRGPWQVWHVGAGRAGHLVWCRRRRRSAASGVRWESSKEPPRAAPTEERPWERDNDGERKKRTSRENDMWDPHVSYLIPCPFALKPNKEQVRPIPINRNSRWVRPNQKIGSAPTHPKRS